MGEIESFWKWFLASRERLHSCAYNDEALLDEVQEVLHLVNAGLAFEIGPPEAIREFVISADGLKDVFPSVVSLVSAAPNSPQWKITAFRPRRLLLPSVELNGCSVDPEDVSFSLLNNGKIAGIHLFLPNFHAENVTLQQIGYLLLDSALGEFDVEMNLGPIKMLDVSSPEEFKRYPFSELPEMFDRLNQRLGRQSVIAH
ncbi:MAG: hypothetical protein HOQ35_01215 [Acidobacteriaceae bacterium]|nr:hypothetical protein [Acidobacteriaceae bacterium]